MKKKVIILVLILGLLAIFFIPLTQQETIQIKAPFLKVYSELNNVNNWKKWHPYLKEILLADSNKISVKKDSNSFNIDYPNSKLNVTTKGNVFIINDLNKSENSNYRYELLPGKTINKTLIIVNKQINVISYLIGRFKPISFSDTHVVDFKNYMETDSLYYGFSIFKAKVPGAYLIEIKKVVLTKNQFEEAAKLLNTLTQYKEATHLTKIYPLIAQFQPISKDSTQINIGFFVDREVKPGKGDIIFARMPKGGPLYSANFVGKFSDRQKAYSALREYFTNYSYQLVILPFDIYLDDKLPLNDTDKVNVRVSFATYF